MDLAMDGYVTVPLLFTVLAVIIASLYLKFRPTDAGVKEESGTAGKVDGSQAGEEKKPNVEGKEGGDGGGGGGDGDGGGRGEDGDGESLKPEGLSGEKSDRRPQGSETRAKEKVTVEEIGAEEATSAHSGEETQRRSESEATPREEQTPAVPGERQEPSPEEKLRKEEDIKVENTKTSRPAEDNEDLVDDTLKYSPGKIRGSHYEKTLTREELEEEQRVQREQLAAIFRLMEENKETFGDMTDGDMEDQLKLYSL